jgi:hypothetical protein
MKRRFSFAVIALLAAAPLLAQAPKGWMVRPDYSSSASDPDAAGAIKFTTSGSGFHATNPNAAVYWNPANMASGNYDLKGKFTMVKGNGTDEYYGLVFGAGDLAGAGQNYFYFMVSDDGTFLIKHHTADGNAQTVAPKTPNGAVKKPDAAGICTNVLEVRAGADKVEFLVNGAVVHSMPKTSAAAKIDGLYGIRVNHRLEVQIDDLAVSKL